MKNCDFRPKFRRAAIVITGQQTTLRTVRIEPLQISSSQQKRSTAIAEPTPGSGGLLQTIFDVTQEAST
ncbi:hypothetical protein DTW90_32915 [Neorhizobium sp. P12A]|nr:hypothetical protein DTW90_32915 [Neorhizobium sp. P12A]